MHFVASVIDADNPSYTTATNAAGRCNRMCKLEQTKKCKIAKTFSIREGTGKETRRGEHRGKSNGRRWRTMRRKVRESEGRKGRGRSEGKGKIKFYQLVASKYMHTFNGPISWTIVGIKTLLSYHWTVTTLFRVHYLCGIYSFFSFCHLIPSSLSHVIFLVNFLLSPSTTLLLFHTVWGPICFTNPSFFRLPSSPGLSSSLGPRLHFYANWFLLLILFIVFPFWFMVVLFAGYSSELFSHLNVYHIVSIFTLLLVHFVAFLCHQHTSGGIMFLTCPSFCAYMNVCQCAFWAEAFSDWLAVNF